MICQAVRDELDAFFRLVAEGGFDLYNEMSLQMELGIYLRARLSPEHRVQFERPVQSLRLAPRATRYTKKEIDIVLADQLQRPRVAIELKFPQAGQVPEQMFKACQDIAFLEEMVEAGLEGGVAIMMTDDPLFYSGNGAEPPYSFFRSGGELRNTIRKPTGKKDEVVNLRGTYRVLWQPVCESRRYYAVEVKRPDLRTAEGDQRGRR